VRDAFRYCLICHCSQCRRATGSAFKPFAGIDSGALHIDHPDRLLRHGDEHAHDGHCSRCGSLLYSLVRDGQFVHVTLGTLLDAPSIRPTAHIHAASKAEWDIICDGLPVFDGFPTEGSG
jgi:hypothetical protein